MSNPAITFNGETIDLAKMPRGAPQFVSGPPRAVRQGVGGVNEIVTEPRIVTHVVAEWLIDTLALRHSLGNWFQWASRGGAFEFAMDAAKTVNTTVQVPASEGDTVIWVNNPTGIAAAGVYRILDGDNMQVVTVSSVSADAVTLSGGLLWDVGVDAVFRDEYYFPGYLPEDSDYPIQIADLGDSQGTWPPVRFIFTLRMREDISQESTMLLKVLAANEAGADVATAQDWFPTLGDVSVAANTTYMFEGELRISRSAGTTSHTTSILMAGTATGTLRYKATCNTGDTMANIAENGISSEVGTAVVIKAASTSATEQISIRVTGVLRITAAGTIIPQFQYSAAPGGAPSVLANSYFKMTPVGSGSFASQGTWA